MPKASGTDGTSTEALRSVLPLAPRDYEILVVLWHEPLHGYGLAKALEARPSAPRRVEPANLYRRLRKLLKYGLIEELAVDAEGPGRPSRTFGLTVLGRAAMREEAGRLRDLVLEARALDLLGEG